MEGKQALRLTGRYEIRKNGELVETGENLVVDTGLYHVADQLADQGEAAMGYMAWGTDDTAPAAGDTALGNEVARKALDSKTQGSGGDANEVVYVGTVTGADVGSLPVTLREVGIFNAASGGVMLDRLVHGDQTLDSADDSLQVTVTLTVSAA